MNRMLVDVPAMRQAQAEVTAAAATAQNTLRLVEQERSSLPAVWSGPAATTYLTTIDEWCQQYRRVAAALDTLGQNLTRAITTLEQAEQNAQALSRA